MLIPKQVFCISKCCDTECTRYALGGVRIERPVDGNPTAIACNSHRLVAVTWNDHDRNDYPVIDDVCAGSGRNMFETTIPVKQWAEASKLPPKRSLTPVLQNVVLDEATANGKVTLSGSDVETTRKIVARSIEGQFPNWKDVIPKYDSTNSVTMKLDAKYLAELAIIVHESGGGDNDQKCSIDLIVPLDGESGVVLKRSGDNDTEATGVLMPLNKTRAK